MERYHPGLPHYFTDDANVTIVEGTWVEDGIELPQEDEEDDE